MNEKQEVAAGLPKPLLDHELNVINIGMEIFYNSLKVQGLTVTYLKWSPQANLNMETEDILNKIL